MSETSPARAHGSAYDEANRRRASRKPSRRLRGWLSWYFVGLVARVVPWIYKGYCWLVWRTSRVTDDLTARLVGSAELHDGFVAVLWHQEVFTVAYGYQHLRGHTLASTSNFGRVITHALEACNFVVFRGGSSRGRVRRREVLRDMIRHMQAGGQVRYGVTVDGSHGPVYQMKSGAVLIAKACGRPLWITRTWYSRYVQADSWDRTALPLPCGRIHLMAVGPYWIRPDADEDEVERCRAHLEDELLELSHLLFRELEGLPPGGVPWAFPPGWRSRWVPGSPGLRRTPWDLRPDDPPPWAHGPTGS